MKLSLITGSRLILGKITLTSRTHREQESAGRNQGPLSSCLSPYLMVFLLALFVTGNASADAPVLSNATEDQGAPAGAVGTPVSALVDIGGALSNVTDADAAPVTVSKQFLNRHSLKITCDLNGL
ncbi:MAG: hypothetical protein KZQ97_11180 [Candidatus Thiodiazotropha sp. (ex Dulcina madagascariensis)]|nr:hypothetical protein [Candidatus Thiodiazotropha sp. (ex Dulcina madagascariensis)]